VGFARTARIAGVAPPTEPADDIRARRMAYFEAMNAGARPGVAVIEDMDGDAALGAWWGEVHAQVHQGVFGLCGAVTNGVMRDLGDMPEGFPILAGSVGPSHGFVHVREIGTPVTVFGMQVADGDLIHADRHGAVCIPLDVIPKAVLARAESWPIRSDSGPSTPTVMETGRVSHSALAETMDEITARPSCSTKTGAPDEPKSTSQEVT